MTESEAAAGTDLSLVARRHRQSDPRRDESTLSGLDHELLLEGGVEIDARGARRGSPGERKILPTGQPGDGDVQNGVSHAGAGHPAVASASASLRESRIRPEGSMSMHLASTSSPSESTSVTFSTRPSAR